ncbi:MAG: helix-turn-helix domain-containing protein [Holophagales bacterium]|nr:helix-turn-helix domain-containing protein [Holophagales bacterium]
MVRYLTTTEAADRLRLAPQTLRVWRANGVGPSYVKPSRSRVLYPYEAITSFLESRTFISTAEETVRRESEQDSGRGSGLNMGRNRGANTTAADLHPAHARTPRSDRNKKAGVL